MGPLIHLLWAIINTMQLAGCPADTGFPDVVLEALGGNGDPGTKKGAVRRGSASKQSKAAIAG